MVFNGENKGDEWSLMEDINGVLTAINGLLKDAGCLQDVSEDILRVFESDGESNHGVSHVHLAPALGGERSEDGAGRVNGERAIVKEVRCPLDELQSVDESKARILAL